MKRTIQFVLSLALVALCIGATTARADEPDPNKPVPLCSDPGRSCSVDRNCCSGSCVHGNCK